MLYPHERRFIAGLCSLGCCFKSESVNRQSQARFAWAKFSWTHFCRACTARERLGSRSPRGTGQRPGPVDVHEPIAALCALISNLRKN
jgi:hypothetical protein